MLHTISVRKNKMNALPSWLCLLPALQALYVDGNPFQGPWKALVEPLLAKVPMTPAYPLSTPTFPHSAVSHVSSNASESTDEELEDSPEPPSASATSNRFNTDEEHTITPSHAPMFHQENTSSQSTFTEPKPTRPLTRTRTTPNRSYQRSPRPETPKKAEPEQPVDVADEQPEVRKMKSAGDLRRNQLSVAPESSPLPVFQRPALTHHAATTDAGLLVSDVHKSPPRPAIGKRYGSVGAASILGVAATKTPVRPALTQSMWEGLDNESTTTATSIETTPFRSSPPNNGEGITQLPVDMSYDPKGTIRARPSKEGKEKTRWGFLKKMSMGKMKPDTSPRVNQSPNPRPQRSELGSPERKSKSPQIDLRFSTTGTLNVSTHSEIPTFVQSPPDSIDEDSSSFSLNIPSSISPSLANMSPSSSLLQPPESTPRSGKRRSFLPLDGTSSLNIPIPENSVFVGGTTATNGDESQDIAREKSPSPVHGSDQYLAREQERAREGYTRALRSVMAYLRDMNDLSLSQQASQTTVYGSAGEPMLSRPRALTTTSHDPSRELSMALGADSSNQLRSANDQGSGRLRSGTSSQTVSVAASDSSQTSEERKIKDDKYQRTRATREILE